MDALIVLFVTTLGIIVTAPATAYMVRVIIRTILH